MPPASRGWITTLKRWRLSSSFIWNRQFASRAPPVSSIGAPLKITLREYQEECIQAVLFHLKQGQKRLGISLATGAGKTVIFTQLIDRVNPPSKSATQTLILAHRQELVEQAARHCTNAYPDKSVEIEMGNLHASGFADITIASVQSLVSGDRMAKFDPTRFKLVLVDEAHHIVAPGYLKTLNYFGLSKAGATPDSPALVGVSATLSRLDGLALKAAIDQIVYHKDYIDMIEDKWLSGVIFTTVQTKADISKVKQGANGDFQASELSEVVNTEQVNEITVRSWLAKALDRKSTLVFCVDLNHVSGLTNTFRRHGIEAQFITGDTPKKERSARLDAFRRGEFPVLVNCGVFTEGTDIPNIDCVLLARPTKSRNLLIQMIGRGMRLHLGKKDCHVIDMVAALQTGIVTTPTLFGLDPSELVESSSPVDMKKLKERKEAEDQRKQKAGEASQAAKSFSNASPKSVTFTDYDNVFDLIEDTSEERSIRARSPLSWVCVAKDKFILTHSTGTFLKLEKTSDEGLPDEDGQEAMYAVSETVALPHGISKSPFMKPRNIARNLDFTGAIHAADTYAQAKYPFAIISRNMAWRKTSATEGQIMFLNKFRLKDDPLTINDLTKGKAGDMITKLKHGARGRFAGIKAEKKKVVRAQGKAHRSRQLAEREKVSVGPVSS